MNYHARFGLVLVGMALWAFLGGPGLIAVVAAIWLGVAIYRWQAHKDFERRTVEVIRRRDRSY